jgi:hypothetical protein
VAELHRPSSRHRDATLVVVGFYATVLGAIVILALSGRPNAATVAVALVSVLGILAERLLPKKDKDSE